MSTATVRTDGRALPDLRLERELAALSDVTSFVALVAASPGLSLPCRNHDPDLWFADRPADLERAKQLCAGCPLKGECLAGALARQEPWGVWGGEIVERGVVIARKRPRGRPSKAALARDRADRLDAEQNTEPQAEPKQCEPIERGCAA